MKKPVIDGIVTGALRPADAVAARLVQRETIHNRLEHESGEILSHAPLPMRRWLRSMETCPDARNLTGGVYGKLTVIGLSVRPGRWVCRCSCGYYTHRTTKALKNPHNTQTACDRCMWTKKIASEAFRDWRPCAQPEPAGNSAGTSRGVPRDT